MTLILLGVIIIHVRHPNLTYTILSVHIIHTQWTIKNVTFFQVRCTHKSGDMINFIIVAFRISLRWYKNHKNRWRLAKVIVKNKMSHFLWFTVYCIIRNVCYMCGWTMPQTKWTDLVCEFACRLLLSFTPTIIMTVCK